MKNSGRLVGVLALSAAVTVLATACDYQANTDTAASDTASEKTVSDASEANAQQSTPAAAQRSSQSTQGSGDVAALIAAGNPKLGSIVVDGTGRTLYRFDKDTNSPSRSTCEGTCAEQWPPVTTTDKPVVAGVNQQLVGVVKRSDGTLQVTLNGWPLYQFAGDSAPGDTNGQGVGGTWFAAATNGAKAKSAARHHGSHGGHGGSTGGYSSY